MATKYLEPTQAVVLKLPLILRLTFLALLEPTQAVVLKRDNKINFFCFHFSRTDTSSCIETVIVFFPFHVEHVLEPTQAVVLKPHHFLWTHLCKFSRTDTSSCIETLQTPFDFFSSVARTDTSSCIETHWAGRAKG